MLWVVYRMPNIEEEKKDNFLAGKASKIEPKCSLEIKL